MSTLKNKPKSWKEQSLPDVGDWRVKGGLAQMLKGGVIMDVVTPDEAKVAEDAGAVAVMALERVPSDIRRDGGVARASDPEMITGIIEAVSIPVMAKARIGHFAEAQVLEALGVDYCDESEVLTPADNEYHINKWEYKMPFVCGATNLGEALRRIGEGASMIRTKGEAGTGDVVQAVTHARQILSDIKKIQMLDDEELMTEAKNKNQLTINLDEQKIILTDENIIEFDIDPFRKKCLIEGLDDIGLTLQKKDKITEYETQLKSSHPWII